jgi:hypothetical protein
LKDLGLSAGQSMTLNTTEDGVVIAIGKRDRNAIYKVAEKR